MFLIRAVIGRTNKFRRSARFGFYTCNQPDITRQAAESDQGKPGFLEQFLDAFFPLHLSAASSHLDAPYTDSISSFSKTFLGSLSNVNSLDKMDNSVGGRCPQVS